MKVAVNLIGNATFTVQIDEVIRFALDPALAPKGSGLGFGIYRKKAPVYTTKTFEKLDFWLLTHAHLDHIDTEGAAMIESNTPIFAAPSCKKAIQQFGLQQEISYLDWNENAVYEKAGYKIEITAIPAYHGYGKLVVKLMTRVNGYMIRISKENESKQIYITSDTVYNQHVAQSLQKHGEIDMMIANLGEAKAPLPVTRKPITMDVRSLQKFAGLTKAKHVIPMHMDDYSHFSTKRSEVQKHFELLEDGETKYYQL